VIRTIDIEERPSDADQFGVYSVFSTSVAAMIRIAALILLVLFGRVTYSRLIPSEPVTLVFLYNDWDVPDQLPGPDQILKEFTRETGIHVQQLPPPEGALNELDLWRELLQKGSQTPDVYGVDVIWPGILANHFLDLKPYFATELSSKDAVLVKSYSVGEKLVAIPYHTNVATLLYRTDLLRKYGYKTPPKTWDELEKMAARIQAGERAAGKKDFWGYVWQGTAGEALTCDALEWQYAQGGGRIIEDDGTVSVNNPNAIRAWQRAARWVGSISPPGVVGYREWDSTNVWASGRAAFHRVWASDSRLAHLAGLQAGETIIGLPMKEKIGVTSMPGGIAGRASVLGGSGLAVSQCSKHPREAIALIRYLLQADAQRKRIRFQPGAAERLELYDLPGILDQDPHSVKRSKPWDGVIARPSSVVGDKYEQVTRAYIRAVHSVLTGERDAREAVAALEKELIGITGFKKGRPSGGDNGLSRGISDSSP
jgi:trehalose/maltose transport system substrate-binding protein